MPDLRAHSPSKIAAGFGGTLNLVISAGYIVVIVLLTALPVHLHLAAKPRSAANVYRPVHSFLGQPGRHWFGNCPDAADRDRCHHLADASRLASLSQTGTVTLQLSLPSRLWPSRRTSLGRLRSILTMQQ